MGLLLLHSIPMYFSHKGLHVCRRPSLPTGTLLEGAANLCPAAQDLCRTLLGFAGVQAAFQPARSTQQTEKIDTGHVGALLDASQGNVCSDVSFRIGGSCPSTQSTALREVPVLEGRDTVHTLFKVNTYAQHLPCRSRRSVRTAWPNEAPPGLIVALLAAPGHLTACS